MRTVTEEKFEETYKKWFIRLPMIFAIILASIGGITSLILAISFQTVWIFFVGALTTTIIALFTNFLCKLILSPKVVTINRLTEIRELLRIQQKSNKAPQIKTVPTSFQKATGKSICPQCGKELTNNECYNCGWKSWL